MRNILPLVLVLILAGTAGCGKSSKKDDPLDLTGNYVIVTGVGTVSRTALTEDAPVVCDDSAWCVVIDTMGSNEARGYVTGSQGMTYQYVFVSWSEGSDEYTFDVDLFTGTEQGPIFTLKIAEDNALTGTACLTDFGASGCQPIETGSKKYPLGSWPE